LKATESSKRYVKAGILELEGTSPTAWEPLRLYGEEVTRRVGGIYSVTVEVSIDYSKCSG